MNISLSDAQIEYILKRQGITSNIIGYPEVAKYKSLEDLFTDNGIIPKSFSTIIDFLSSPSYGHWTLLFRHPNGELEFFDSYGLFLGDEKYFINPIELIRLNQHKPWITRLLGREPLIWNDIQLQRFDPDVSTCGQWCIDRLVHYKMNIAEYIKHVGASGLSPDQYVVRNFQKYIS